MSHVILQSMVKKCSGTASIFADARNCRNIPIGDFSSSEHHNLTYQMLCCYLTSEVAENFINHINNIPPQILPSSSDDLINNFNNKLKTTINAIAPAKLKNITSKQKPSWRTGDISVKKNCRKASDPDSDSGNSNYPRRAIQFHSLPSSHK